jgi:hypothetical protein
MVGMETYASKTEQGISRLVEFFGGQRKEGSVVVD